MTGPAPVGLDEVNTQAYYQERSTLVEEALSLGIPPEDITGLSNADLELATLDEAAQQEPPLVVTHSDNNILLNNGPLLTGTDAEGPQTISLNGEGQTVVIQVEEMTDFQPNNSNLTVNEDGTVTVGIHRENTTALVPDLAPDHTDTVVIENPTRIVLEGPNGQTATYLYEYNETTERMDLRAVRSEDLESVVITDFSPGLPNQNGILTRTWQSTSCGSLTDLINTPPARAGLLPLPNDAVSPVDAVQVYPNGDVRSSLDLPYHYTAGHDIQGNLESFAPQLIVGVNGGLFQPDGTPLLNNADPAVSAYATWLATSSEADMLALAQTRANEIAAEIGLSPNQVLATITDPEHPMFTALMMEAAENAANTSELGEKLQLDAQIGYVSREISTMVTLGELEGVLDERQASEMLSRVQQAQSQAELDSILGEYVPFLESRNNVDQAFLDFLATDPATFMPGEAVTIELYLTDTRTQDELADAINSLNDPNSQFIQDLAASMYADPEEVVSRYAPLVERLQSEQYLHQTTDSFLESCQEARDITANQIENQFEDFAAQTSASILFNSESVLNNAIMDGVHRYAEENIDLGMEDGVINEDALIRDITEDPQLLNDPAFRAEHPDLINMIISSRQATIAQTISDGQNIYFSEETLTEVFDGQAQEWTPEFQARLEERIRLEANSQVMPNDPRINTLYTTTMTMANPTIEDTDSNHHEQQAMQFLNEVNTVFSDTYYNTLVDQRNDFERSLNRKFLMADQIAAALGDMTTDAANTLLDDSLNIIGYYYGGRTDFHNWVTTKGEAEAAMNAALAEMDTQLGIFRTTLDSDNSLMSLQNGWNTYQANLGESTAVQQAFDSIAHFSGISTGTAIWEKVALAMGTGVVGGVLGGAIFGSSALAANAGINAAKIGTGILTGGLNVAANAVNRAVDGTEYDLYQAGVDFYGGFMGPILPMPNNIGQWLLNGTAMSGVPIGLGMLAGQEMPPEMMVQDLFTNLAFDAVFAYFGAGDAPNAPKRSAYAEALGGRPQEGNANGIRIRMTVLGDYGHLRGKY